MPGGDRREQARVGPFTVAGTVDDGQVVLRFDTAAAHVLAAALSSVAERMPSAGTTGPLCTAAAQQIDAALAGRPTAANS